MLFSGAANNQGMKADALRAARRRSTLSRGNVMGLRAGSTCLKCLLLLAIVVAGGARAQPANYPDKPVRIISDAAPGGAIDTNLRIIAESLSKKWAQQVVIENRPGAGGAISATAAAQAPPDGYTIYAPASSMFLTIPGKAPNLPLKLPRDFAAIGITVLQPQSIGINVLTDPEIRDKLAARGAYVHPATPTEAQAFVRSQQELWKPALEHVAVQFKNE